MKSIACASLWLIRAAMALILLASVAGAQPQTPTELEGTWEGVRSTVAEADRTFKDGEMRLVFNGMSLQATGFLGPGTVNVLFTLDAKNKHFDYTRKPGEIIQCLYKIDGNVLTLAVPRTSTARPSKIDPTTKEAVILTLKRR